MRDGDVITGRGFTQLRAQTPTVEDRQGNRRADAVVEFLAGQKLQRPTAGGHVAEAADQIDIGIKTGMGHVDAPCLRRHLPAAGDHVRTLTE
ncbi:hypothetical protein D3C71_1554660 [compost metagenome]